MLMICKMLQPGGKFGIRLESQVSARNGPDSGPAIGLCTSVLTHLRHVICCTGYIDFQYAKACIVTGTMQFQGYLKSATIVKGICPF